MKIKVFDTNKDACQEAAQIISELINSNPKAVLGLATGRTPLELYSHLIKHHEKGLSFKEVTTFNLDEYHNLRESHPDSYQIYMKKHFFEHVDLDLNNTHFPTSEESPYDALIDSKGGIDLQILGIGVNGHIGFNEPSTVFQRFTHLTKLSESTLNTNRHLVSEQMPTHAITMGIESIFKAKKIILIANGREKGEILRKALKNVISAEIPASILALHPNVHLFLDSIAHRAFEGH